MTAFAGRLDCMDNPITASPSFGWPWLITVLLLALGLALLVFRYCRRSTQKERFLEALSRDRDLVLRSISDNVTFLDNQLRIVWTNWADRADARSLHPVTEGLVCHQVVAGQTDPCKGCPVPAVFKTGKAVEGLVTRRDGVILRMCAAPVRDERGRLVGVVQTTRDITEKRRLAERLQQSQKLEAVGQLAAGVAHDFNNSLQAVLGYADLLAARVPADAEAQNYVQAMHRSGDHARKVVGQLLTFSRKREPLIELMDLGSWLQAQLGILRLWMGRNIEVQLTVTPDLPGIPADASQVEQALLNLCTNARDAMPEGGRLDLLIEPLTLSAAEAKRRGAPDAGTYVLLSVVDQGVGIERELQNRVFDPFFTTKQVDQGSGLGLATVYGIVTGHGGFIELQSAPGAGSTFRLGWPVGDDPPGS
jgi:two-component system, cell cycle sensor histidine kinase and response regulator CckA